VVRKGGDEKTFTGHLFRKIFNDKAESDHVFRRRDGQVEEVG
jgi:hypothetical protein